MTQGKRESPKATTALPLACALTLAVLATQAQVADGAASEEVLGQGPLQLPGFVRNEGQWSGECHYAAFLETGSAVVTDRSLVIAERVAAGAPTAAAAYELRWPAPETVVADGRRSEYANFLRGSDPSRWRGHVPCFDRVVARGIAAGIDLVIAASRREVTYDLLCAPGADLGQLAIECLGVDGLEVDDRGDLILDTPFGPRVHSRPRAYQLSREGARREVACAYRLLSGHAFGFACESDPEHPTVIDPSVVFATYLGSSGEDVVQRIALHPSTGAIYATGWTNSGAGSGAFPTTSGAYDTTYNGTTDLDIFVSKFNSTGSSLVYSTFIGGDAEDRGRGLAVDSSGEATIVGETYSSGFPTTSNAFDTTYNGSGDAYVARLSDDGSALAYGTFLGGSGLEGAIACTLDGSGNVFAIGSTGSTAFPVTANAYQSTFLNQLDLFIVEVDPAGSGTNDLVYSTYLSGDQYDGARAIALDSQGRVCIAACTNSSAGLPITISSSGSPPATWGSTYSGGDDCYIAVLVPGQTGSAFAPFARYLGGNSHDDPTDLVVDDADNLYVCGLTYSTSGFYFSSGALDTTGDSQGDALVAALDPLQPMDGTPVLLTLFGGSSLDVAKGIRLESGGAMFLGGDTKSSDFPTAGQALDTTLDGTQDAFVVRLNAAASALTYSSYFGGNDADETLSVAYTPRPTFTIGGRTSSTNLGSMGAYDTSHNGAADGFVAKFDFR